MLAYVYKHRYNMCLKVDVLIKWNIFTAFHANVTLCIEVLKTLHIEVD